MVIGMTHHVYLLTLVSILDNVILIDDYVQTLDNVQTSVTVSSCRYTSTLEPRLSGPLCAGSRPDK